MKTLDDYEVISVIGTGSFGTCFKVRDKRTSEIYAWKAIDYDELSETKKEILTSEIFLLRQLNHPNIVQYFHHILNHETKTIYIVMECCTGGDLASLIEKCRRENLQFEEKFIWHLLYQLCKALQYCHNKITEGIILHRDIKPANIFLNSDGTVKLGDFGLARILRRNSDEFAETLVGTPYYMSPELIKGRRYDWKSDVWAVGCLIYEMCALKTPFVGSRFDQLSRNITNGEFNSIPENYSADLQNIISFMLEVHSEHRPNTDTVLRHPVLVRNIIQTQNEYPQLIPSVCRDNIYKNSKKLNFSPNLSSTILTQFSMSSNELARSYSRMSGVSTPTLRAELFGTASKQTLTNSNPELTNYETELLILNKNTPQIKLSSNDPETLTNEIFDSELRRRLQKIRAQESLLLQRAANLIVKENELNEREKRLTETEKQLEDRKIYIENLFRRKKFEKILKRQSKRRIPSLDDTYCTIEPNDTVIAPTVAKLNLAVMPPPKQFSRKTVTFNSPKRFVKINIENTVPIPPPLKFASCSTKKDNNNKNDMKSNCMVSSLSSKSSGDSEPNPKRKSILSLFGINTNNKFTKDRKKELCTIINKSNSLRDIKPILNNKNQTATKSSDNIHSTNLTRWTIENKKAAFEMLAAMNAAEKKNITSSETNENNLNIIRQNWQRSTSTRERSGFQRNKQRHSMMVLTDAQSRIIL